jgi:hypothetical protein
MLVSGTDALPPARGSRGSLSKKAGDSCLTVSQLLMSITGVGTTVEACIEVKPVMAQYNIDIAIAKTTLCSCFGDRQTASTAPTHRVVAVPPAHHQQAENRHNLVM